jgi:hypothetical protein
MPNITKSEIEKNLIKFIETNIILDYPDMDPIIAHDFISKAFWSGVIKSSENEDLLNWYKNIFKKNLFILDQDDYSEASIDALKKQFSLAGTDFGSSKQRDLGQKWADTIRGYLGEIGVRKLLKSKYNLEISLAHEPGDLEEFVSKDIHEVKFQNQEKRKPKIKVSIKTVKSNGIWLDFTEQMFIHADVHINCCVGVGTNHLFSFFKHLSVFKDKIIKNAIDRNFINQEEGNNIYDQVPSFKNIYGYVPGFVVKKSEYESFSYDGKKGRLNYTIDKWSGKYLHSYLEIVKNNENVEKGVKFLGIGVFSRENIYVFGLSSLMWSDDDWKNLIINKI